MPRLPMPAAEPVNLVTLAEIARGGMGSVELARAEGGKINGQLVAVKRLHPAIAMDPQFVGMFLDEAWMTAALDSPNVVKALSWGNDAKGMYLAVEFVRGVSLSRLYKEVAINKELFAERTVAFVASQICAGLSNAHGLRGDDNNLLGLVHRDLTPGNILISFDGIVKIVDFGIAKAEERITHTRTGTLKGKPAYMAPEQSRGGNVDLRADIFSLGVVIFEMLTLRRPWTAKSAFDVMLEVASTPAPELVTLRKNVSPVFIEIVKTCLEKKPEDRFQSCAEIQKRLDEWRKSKGFDPDDAQSLAQFVVRNSGAQIKWYDDALRGEMIRSKQPTFKEMEERIDAERESGRQAGAPRILPAAGRPASGAHALAALAAPMPTSAAQGARPAMPTAGRMVLPAEPQEMPTIVNPQARITPPAMKAVTPPAPGAAQAQRPSNMPVSQNPLDYQRGLGLGGTQFMPQTPIVDFDPHAHDVRTMQSPAVDPALIQSHREPSIEIIGGHRPGPAPQHSGPTLASGGLEPPPRRSGAHLPPPTGEITPDLPLPPPSDPGKTPLKRLAATAPMDPEALRQASMRGAASGQGPRPMGVLEATVSDPSLASPIGQKKKKGSSAPIVVLLLLVVLGGGAAAAYRFRARLMQYLPGRAAPPAPAASDAAPPAAS